MMQYQALSWEARKEKLEAGKLQYVSSQNNLNLWKMLFKAYGFIHRAPVATCHLPESFAAVHS